MNDADIIKALECCKDRRCDICVRLNSGPDEECICRLELIEQAFDLIKRQQAETERLKERLDHSIGIDKTGSNWFPFD